MRVILGIPCKVISNFILHKTYFVKYFFSEFYSPYRALHRWTKRSIDEPVYNAGFTYT